MKDLLKMTGTLALISVLAGGLLAVTNSITRAPIAASKRAEKLDAMRKVLPEYDNNPDTDVRVINDGSREWIFYLARRAEQIVGVAFEASSDQGYSGTIKILAGVGMDGKVIGLEIIDQCETPGLGARIVEPEFTDQFKNSKIASTKWAVTKDGGDIHAITGATISPRAVVEALKKGLDVYESRKQEIVSAH